LLADVVAVCEELMCDVVESTLRGVEEPCTRRHSKLPAAQLLGAGGTCGECCGLGEEVALETIGDDDIGQDDLGRHTRGLVENGQPDVAHLRAYDAVA
jgi:hypothetical protein